MVPEQIRPNYYNPESQGHCSSLTYFQAGDSPDPEDILPSAVADEGLDLSLLLLYLLALSINSGVLPIN